MSGDEEDLNDWERCVSWLHRCMILSQEQKEAVGCVDHLALFLRDGVMLCLLLNRLHPGAVDPRSFSQRPQMSQFLCLKNIRVFLQSCKKVFGMKDSALFEASDLFEMKDFKKVVESLSLLSKTKEAKKSGIEPFSAEDDEDYEIFDQEFPEDMYNVYSDHIYGNSAEDADEDVYGQLIDYQPRTSVPVTQMSPRDHCIKEILDTEKKYVDVLNMIMEKFHTPLKSVLTGDDCQVIFHNITELRTIHRNLLSDLALVKGSGTSSSWTSAEQTIPGCFVKHKMKLVIYGDYCANLQKVQDRLEQCLKLQRVKDLVEAKSEEAKVKLRDVLVVPFQRVLKYHLLIDQLKRVSDENSREMPVIELAHEEMQDVSMYVNEVKRDSENLALISEIENSVSDLNKYMQPGTRLQQYGRRLHDGDVKIRLPKDKNFDVRYAFLLDKVLLICRPRGDNYNYKDVLVLSCFELEEHIQERGYHCFKLTDSSNTDRDKPAKSYIFGVKSPEQKEKWWSSILLGKSNVSPDGCDSAEFRFRMCTFEQPTICDVCRKLLKGVFFQGYRCHSTGMTVHKECIKKAAAVREIRPDTKVKATAEYNGQPGPMVRGQQPLTFGIGDVITVEKVSGDWIKGRLNDKVGFFPVGKVRVLVTAKHSYEEAVGSPTLSNGQPPSSQPPNKRVVPEPPISTRAPAKPPVKAMERLTVSPEAPETTDRTKRSVPEPPSSSRIPDKRDNRVVSGNSSSSGRQSNVGTKRQTMSSEIGKPWFAGPISRPAASEILQNTKTGTYLIRYSPDKQEYALSLSDASSKDLVRHLKVHKDERGFYLATMLPFDDLVKLVDYYTSNSLQESFPNITTCLLGPYQLVEKRAVNEPGIAGYCIALHDYDANETSQLSFCVNDKIAIISKTSMYPLWWKGRLNGKVGIIPSNYVKEL